MVLKIVKFYIMLSYTFYYFNFYVYFVNTFQLNKDLEPPPPYEVINNNYKSSDINDEHLKSNPHDHFDSEKVGKAGT